MAEVGNRQGGRIVQHAYGSRKEDEAVRQFELLARLAARRMAKRTPVDYEDLFADALMGVLAGVRTFDPANPRGATLKTWVTLKVRYAMIDGIRERSDLLGSSRGHWKAVAAGEARPIAVLSLDAAKKRRGDNAREEHVRDDLAAKDDRRGRDDVEYALRGLTPRSRRMIVGYYLDDLDLKTIGAELGIGQSMASRAMIDLVAFLREREA